MTKPPLAPLNRSEQPSFERIRPVRSALVVACGYAALGLVWVTFSDRLLFALVSDSQRLAVIEVVKGQAFVLVTSIGLFSLVSSYLRLLKAAEARYERQERSKELAVRQGYVDVLAAVTGGKLILLTTSELVTLLGDSLQMPRLINGPAELADARHEIKSLLESQRIHDADSVLIAVSEALTNGIKHGTRCGYEIRRVRDALQIAVFDEGPGIDFRSLAKATLIQGFTTTSTLGLGFTIMLEVCDRVLLRTDSTGTTVVLEVGLGLADIPFQNRLPQLAV